MKNIICLSVFVISLVGCGSGRLIDADIKDTDRKFSSIKIKNIQSGVPVSRDAKKQFEATLSNLLYNDIKFKRGDELTLNYKFICSSEGNRFQRWCFGGMAGGEGTIIIEAIYKDKTGKEIGKVRSQGEIGAGFFGGSFSNALEKAAEEIANQASFFKK